MAKDQTKYHKSKTAMVTRKVTSKSTAPNRTVRNKSKGPSIKQSKGPSINTRRLKSMLNNHLRNRPDNMTKLLQLVCQNPDKCLALGPYADPLKHYFEDFRNLSLVDSSSIKVLSKNTANGFVFELPFVKNGYRAYTAFKMAARADSDNLFYEYYVGKFFINKYLNILPCFVETYDYYLFNHPYFWLKTRIAAKENLKLNIPDYIIRKEVDETDYDNFTESCAENRRGCILIQHFDEFRSLHDEFSPLWMPKTKVQTKVKTPATAAKTRVAKAKAGVAEVTQYDAMQSLFQVYFGLHYLGNRYTHYDLHAGNVFLYKPYGSQSKKYILMRYHFTKTGVTVTFKTRHIAKIIDYGRNYFNNRPNAYTSKDQHKSTDKGQHKSTDKDQHKSKDKDQNKSTDKDQNKSKDKDQNKSKDKDQNKSKDKDQNKSKDQHKSKNSGISTDIIIQNYIKDKAKCNPNCGDDVGYYTIQGNACDPNTIHYWIYPNKPNMSHDLRCYNYMARQFITSWPQVVYSNNYGTDEKASDPTGKTINNVSDLVNMLTNYLLNNKHYAHYATWTRAATMDVYDDGRPYTFVVEPEL